MTTAIPVRQNLSKRLRDNKQFRQHFFRSRTRNKIAVELRQLRELRGLKQSELKKKFGIHQSAISRIEQADYSSWTYKTLWKATDALDGVLDVSIRPVEHDIEQFQKKELAEEEEIRKREQMNNQLRDKSVQQAIAAASLPLPTDDRRIVDLDAYRMAHGLRSSQKNGLLRQALKGNDPSTQLSPAQVGSKESQTLVQAIGGR